MDVFIMTYVKNTTVHKLKKQQKYPVYEDKSDSRRKVVVVRGTLKLSLYSEKNLTNFWYILYYCTPTMRTFTKKTLLKYWE